MQFIPVAAFDNYIEANIVLGRLVDENINCWLKDEHTATVSPIWSQAIGGIKLMVAEPHLSRALTILQQIKDDRIKKIKCPKCGSLSVEYVNRPKASNWFVALFSFLFASYAMTADKAYHCFQCGHEFSSLSDDE